MNSKLKESIITIDKKKQKFLQAKMINHIAQVYFFFAEEKEDFDNETDIDEFVEYMWSIATMTAASLGAKVVGETADGRIIVELQPCKSVKEFFIKQNLVEEEDDSTWEDLLDNSYDDVTEGGEIDFDWEEFTEIFE